MEMVKNERDIRNWYERYVNSFHRNDVEYMKNINLKYDHTERVVIEARGIGISLHLDHHDLTLVMLSAMLHDLGRYQQLRDFGTFNDRQSINHAELALKILDDEKVLENLDREDAALIRCAVIHHNKLEVSPELSKREMMFSKILRDADKLDILRIVSQHYTQSEPERNGTIDFNLPEGDSVHEDILESLNQKKIVRVQQVSNRTELKLLQLGWVYDLNFPWTCQLVENRKFIESIVSTLPKSAELKSYCDRVIADLVLRAHDAKVSGLRGR